MLPALDVLFLWIYDLADMIFHEIIQFFGFFFKAISSNFTDMATEKLTWSSVMLEFSNTKDPPYFFSENGLMLNLTTFVKTI